MTDSPTGVLKQTFPMLSDESIERISEVARVAEYTEGTHLAEEGALEDVFYVVLRGQVDVYKSTDNVAQYINSLGAGACFGEIALLLDTPRTATVKAATSVRLLEIDRETFARYLKSNLEIVTAINNLVIQRALQQEKKLLSQLSDLHRPHQGGRVFISYARVDKPFVVDLAAGLEARGVSVWYDQQIPGGNTWYEEIQKALDSCTLMVLVLSPTGVESRNVADEWHYYLDEGKAVVPVLYQACRVPYQLRRLQHVNFVELDFEEALEQLVETIQARS